MGAEDLCGLETCWWLEDEGETEEEEDADSDREVTQLRLQVSVRSQKKLSKHEYPVLFHVGFYLFGERGEQDFGERGRFPRERGTCATRPSTSPSAQLRSPRYQLFSLIVDSTKR